MPLESKSARGFGKGVLHLNKGLSHQCGQDQSRGPSHKGASPALDKAASTAQSPGVAGRWLCGSQGKVCHMPLSTREWGGYESIDRFAHLKKYMAKRWTENFYKLVTDKGKGGKGQRGQARASLKTYLVSFISVPSKYVTYLKLQFHFEKTEFENKPNHSIQRCKPPFAHPVFTQWQKYTERKDFKGLKTQ